MVSAFMRFRSYLLDGCTTLPRFHHPWSRDPTNLSATTSTIVMETQLGNLCELCKTLRFDVRPSQEHSGLDVTPKLFQHAENIHAPRRFALKGCHLCTLFVSGLDLSRPEEALDGDGLPTSPARTPPRSRVRAPPRSLAWDERWQVTVRYFPYYQSVPFDHGERLEVYCGNRSIPLFLESIPDRDTKLSLQSESDSGSCGNPIQRDLRPFHLSQQDLCKSADSLSRLYMFNHT